MSELAQVWQQVEILLQDGLSIIPVRDKDEEGKDGKTYGKKTAYYKWKEYQSKIISKDDLWKQMEYRNTSAIAIVCGKISGNLEVIDVDTKYKDDAGILLFAAIKDFDQRLFELLRIHKTPSGGYHIIYKISDPPEILPGNTKLAGRMPTDDEISANPKIKPLNFLETRADGGYILAPPSMGYTIHKNNPIPLLTWEQRNNLINIAKTFDTIIKVAPPVYKQTVRDESYYDENPWDDYNRRCDPIELLTSNGWITERTANAHNIYFTRPGKTNGISMSFRNEIRKFYCFTVSTEFEPDTAYSPVSVLLKLSFNDDKKRCFSWLVDNGYGRVKPKIEKSLAISLARKNKEVPANFSQEAIVINKQTIEQLKEDHPFGIFVKYSIDEEKLAVSREVLLYVANNLGFRYHEEETVRINGNFISKITEREFQDALKQYIHEEDANEYELICNTYESFMQKNGKYTMTRLELLDADLILKDKKDVCYKYYKNGFLTISANNIEFSLYEDNNMLIWQHSIQSRDYKEGTKGGVYVDFLNKATLPTSNIKKVIGYLAHEYKDETTAYIIVITESCPDPMMGGGSGKNVFCNLLKLTTTYTSKPGSQAKFDEKFFQSWNKQRIFGISDVDKDFNFMFLKEPSSGVFIWKKLFKDELEVAVEDGPKFIVQTNYSYEIADGGLKRRIIPVEFTDFFTKEGGLDMHYKKHFPDQWDETDYGGYDNYVAEAVQEWLKCGRKLYAVDLTDTGKNKQWEQTYGKYTVAFIHEHLDNWLNVKNVSNYEFKRQYELWVSDNSIAKSFQPSMMKINLALDALAKMSNWTFDKDISIKDDTGNNFKHRIFEKLPF